MRTLRAAAVAVAVLATLSACGAGSTLGEGDTVQGPTTVDGTAYEFRVPSGGITVTIGEPVDSVDSASGDEASAPDGGALLPVSWALDRQRPLPVTGFDQEAKIAIETDGETVDVVTIPDTPVSSDAVYVAVPGDGTDVTASVTYDGVTQVIGADGERDGGIAEALYDDAAGGDLRDCPESASASRAQTSTAGCAAGCCPTCPATGGQRTVRPTCSSSPTWPSGA